MAVVFLTIMLTEALQTFRSLCLKTACTFHFKVYALIPLENWQTVRCNIGYEQPDKIPR